MSASLTPSGQQRGVTQASLRARNLGVVVRHVLAAPDPVSRAQIAAATGMTRSTASRLVDLLVDGGLLAEDAPVQTLGPGRPGVPVRPARGTLAALGLQVNSARVGARLVDLAGEVIAESTDEHAPAERPPQQTVDQLRARVQEVLAQAPSGLRLVGAGLSLPGVVDSVRRRVVAAPYHGWSGLDLDELLHGLVPGVRVEVASESSYAARAVLEPRPGRAGELRDGLVVHGDVGVGAALLIDGAVRDNGQGMAGALGHVPVRFTGTGPTCGCGAEGCLDAYIGRPALVGRAGLAPGTSLREVAERAQAGHQGALDAVREGAQALAAVLAGAVALTGTTTIVLAGELGRLTDLVRPHLQEAVHTHGLRTERLVEVRPATDALLALTGAAVSVLGAVVREPAAFLDSP